MNRSRSLEVHSGWGDAVAGASDWVAFLIGFAAGVLVEAVQWAFSRAGGVVLSVVDLKAAMRAKQ